MHIPMIEAAYDAGEQIFWGGLNKTNIVGQRNIYSE